MVSIVLRAGDGNVEFSYASPRLYRRNTKRNERKRLWFIAGDPEYGERSSSLTKRVGTVQSRSEMITR